MLLFLTHLYNSKPGAVEQHVVEKGTRCLPYRCPSLGTPGPAHSTASILSTRHSRPHLFCSAIGAPKITPADFRHARSTAIKFHRTARQVQARNPLQRLPPPPPPPDPQPRRSAKGPQQDATRPRRAACPGKVMADPVSPRCRSPEGLP